MHPNPAFRKAEAAANLAFAAERGFGLLAVSAPGGPLAAHVPFVITEDGATLETHLVRSNPIARALAGGPVPALLAVSGPDGYVSPDWYGTQDQVPTWNYVAVHFRGPLSLAAPETLRDVLARISDTFEPRLAPKRPWTMDKMTPAALERLMRAIVPARLTIEGVDGTWKLGQNKDESARLGAAAGVEGSVGADLAALAALMRDPPA
ncbi:MAG TPA: FMN-binding negative transcriptional regulator [Paracoccaceae bacterium]|nr:FMN-binding negative transcriptional regulator [Paracoccaceae bacterium]